MSDDISSASDQSSQLPDITAGDGRVAKIYDAEVFEELAKNQGPCEHKWSIEGDEWVCFWCGKHVDIPYPEDEKCSIATQNIRDGWDALAMIREAVENSAPVGSVPRSEYLAEPTPFHEAMAIIQGVAAMRAQMDEAIGCFEAAYTEGLADVLSAQDETGVQSLHDLVTRRILYAHHALTAPAALSQTETGSKNADETRG